MILVFLNEIRILAFDKFRIEGKKSQLSEALNDRFSGFLLFSGSNPIKSWKK